MRILHLTDTHLGHVRVLIGGPRGWSRADDHHDAFVRALTPALRDEVDLVVHSGDVFDRSRPPAADVERALTVLGEVARRVPVVAIAGNHDRRGLGHHRAPAGVTLVDEPRRIDHGGAQLGFVPYQRTREGFRAAVDGLGTLDLLVCHQAFDGVAIPRPGGRPFVFRVARQDDTVGPHDIRRVDAVACGHIHPRQVVRYGRCAVVHPGSTERTAFAERDQTKGFALWQLGRRPTWRFVDLSTR
ncbi:MAG: metallophosphoesterase, partial [Myxococcota bacterium]